MTKYKTPKLQLIVTGLLELVKIIMPLYGGDTWKLRFRKQIKKRVEDLEHQNELQAEAIARLTEAVDELSKAD